MVVGYSLKSQTNCLFLNFMNEIIGNQNTTEQDPNAMTMVSL
jgi:hypothetical protein